MKSLDARVLFVHNRYQARAGEDLSFDADRRSLVERGIHVADYVRDNDEIDSAAPFDKLKIAAGVSWAPAAKSRVARMLEDVRPHLAHFHNTFPLISPAPYWACREAGVPVVQTLRNFRIFCAPGIFFRDGHVCEDCVGKRIVWPGVIHACYRSSRPKTVPVAAMQTVHRWMRTWSRLVDAYVVPSSFMRTKLADCGLPAHRLHVRPDVVAVNGGGDVAREEWGLFAGRLTPEKGILTLLEAASRVEDIELKVIGSGPLESDVRVSVAPHLRSRVELLGGLSHDETISLFRRARFVVVPSESYETFGRVAVEAFACGTPVIASRIGALEEVVEDGVTGLQFRAGDPHDLARALAWAVGHPERMAEMGRAGRVTYEARYAPRAAFDALMEIYERTARASGRSRFSALLPKRD